MPVYYEPDYERRAMMRGQQGLASILSNLSMLAVQQNFRAKEADIARKHAEKIASLDLQSRGLARPTQGARTEQVTMAGVQPTTTTSTVRVKRPPETPDTTLAGQALKFTPEGRHIKPVPLTEDGKVIGYYSPKTGQAQYRPAGPTPASIIQEWALWKSQNPQGTTAQFYAERKQAQPSTTINLGDKGSLKWNEAMARKTIETHEEMVKTQVSLQNLQPIKQLLNKPMIAGVGAKQILFIAKGLQQAGLIELGGTTEQAITNTEAFFSQMGNQVGQIIKQFGAGTGLSDADREYAQKIVGGEITLSHTSLKKISAIYEKATLNVLKNWNKRASQVMKNVKDLPYDLRVEIPSTTDYSQVSDAALMKRLGLSQRR